MLFYSSLFILNRVELFWLHKPSASRYAPLNELPMYYTPGTGELEMWTWQHTAGVRQVGVSQTKSRLLASLEPRRKEHRLRGASQVLQLMGGSTHLTVTNISAGSISIAPLNASIRLFIQKNKLGQLVSQDKFFHQDIRCSYILSAGSVPIFNFFSIIKLVFFLHKFKISNDVD